VLKRNLRLQSEVHIKLYSDRYTTLQMSFAEELCQLANHPRGNRYVRRRCFCCFFSAGIYYLFGIGAIAPSVSKGSCTSLVKMATKLDRAENVSSAVISQFHLFFKIFQTSVRVRNTHCELCHSSFAQLQMAGGKEVCRTKSS